MIMLKQEEIMYLLLFHTLPYNLMTENNNYSLFIQSPRIDWAVMLSDNARLSWTLLCVSGQLAEAAIFWLGASWPLRSNLYNWHTITSAIVHWPKQITRPAKVQGMGKKTSPLEGEKLAQVTLPRAGIQGWEEEWDDFYDRPATIPFSRL